MHAHSTARYPAPRQPTWERGDLRAWWRSLDRDRRREDRALVESTLERVAEASPTAATAIDWARENKVAFVVDKEFFCPGWADPLSGTVHLIDWLLRSRSSPSSFLNGLVVHEIRHLWQKQKSLFPGADFFDKVALSRLILFEAMTEADAYAHGQLAAREGGRAFSGRSEDVTFLLRTGFKEWFALYARRYGRSMRLSARSFFDDFDGKPACFDSQQVRLTYEIHGQARDVYSRDYLVALGESFAGVNYLKDWVRDDREIQKFFNFILSPANALRDFNENAPIPSLAEEIRKRQLQLTVAQPGTPTIRRKLP